MGPRAYLTRILGLVGYRIQSISLKEQAPSARMTIRIERKVLQGHRCPNCHRRCSRIRDQKDRSWDDLPWAEHPVTIVYCLRRVHCPRCGIRTETVPFADSHARVTRRLRNRIALDCQSMPTSHAAVRHGVSWGKARRAERDFLQHWDRNRPRRRPTHLGADEIQRGRGHRYWTVLSDLIHGEVIGLAKDRSEEALSSLLSGCLDARQRAAVQAFCTDMHKPYLNAIAAHVPRAEVVFDKFHVLQHASRAIDELRRAEFFRAGPLMRAYGRGKRWLLLRRWENLETEQRDSLRELFAVNRRLFKAYVLREQLDRLWTYKSEYGVRNFLARWVLALRWQRLPQMVKLAAFLVKHIGGIVAYTRHRVRFGLVESINNTIKSVVRRARGMRDAAMLLLKLKWTTAHPIRSARDLKRFLEFGMHTKR